MDLQQKDSYTEPVLIVHELLRDLTGTKYQEKSNSEKPGDTPG